MDYLRLFFLDGLWLWFRLRLLFWSRSSLRLTNLREINLAQCLQTSALFQHLFGLGDCFLSLFGLLDFLFLCFLGKYHIGLSLHCLVGAELVNQCLILFVRNLGICRSVIANLAQTALLLQEINSRLKSYIQF